MPQTISHPFAGLLAGTDPAGDPGWRRALRERGRERFEAAGFPGPREEAWRFTRLRPLERGAIVPAPEIAAGAPPPAQASLVDEAAVRLVFINGRFFPGLSRTEGVDGLDVAPFSGGFEPPEGFGDIANRHRFAALNDALFVDGARVRIFGDASERPVHLLFWSAKGEARSANHPRVWIEAETGARGLVIEEYAGEPGAEAFVNPVTEVRVGANAAVECIRLQHETDETVHVGAHAVRLERDARYTHHSLALGARLSRLDVDAVLSGPGAEVHLNGLFLLRGKEHADHHLTVDHAAAHTTSRQLYKGVLDDRSAGVFNGRVIVRKDAQRVDAGQTNNNLLLSEEALVNTNPELQIFADDIQAQHGATIGQIDEDQLFYLRSRGLDRETARQMLIEAFARDVVDRLPLESLRERLATRLEELFG